MSSLTVFAFVFYVAENHSAIELRRLVLFDSWHPQIETRHTSGQVTGL